jgi:hypothetical protein
MVADRATLPCQGYCKAVSFKLQGYSFKSHLYLLSLGGCDMVLAVDWLRLLGPILWDFKVLTMKFSYMGNDSKEVLLQGLLP